MIHYFFVYFADGVSCSDNYDLISDSRYGVPNTSLTASSEYSTTFSANSSRFSAGHIGWAAKLNQRPDWIQVDFLHVVNIVAVHTQANTAREFTRQFTISTSLDGVNWNTIQENGEDVVFEGNTDSTNIVTNPLPDPIKTRFIRLNVVEYHLFPALRWAIDGCPV